MLTKLALFVMNLLMVMVNTVFLIMLNLTFKYNDSSLFFNCDCVGNFHGIHLVSLRYGCVMLHVMNRSVIVTSKFRVSPHTPKIEKLEKDRNIVHV